MKKEYDFSKMKRRPGKVKVYPEANKTAISLRVDALDMIAIKTEAYRLGLPYQTFLCSILHRYVTGELVDLKSVDIEKLLKKK